MTEHAGASSTKLSDEQRAVLTADERSLLGDDLAAPTAVELQLLAALADERIAHQATKAAADRRAARPRDPARCAAAAAALIEPLRAVAREHGYALTEHGSMQRDIDLVAIPWRHGDCAAPIDLAGAIKTKALSAAPCLAYRHRRRAGPAGCRVHNRRQQSKRVDRDHHVGCLRRSLARV